MKKIMIIGNLNKGTYLFRKELILDLNGRNKVLLGLSGRDKYFSFFEEHGVCCEDLNLDRTGKKIGKEMLMIRTLYRYIRRHKPDVLLAYTIKPIFYVGIIKLFTRSNFLFFPFFVGLGYYLNNDTRKNGLMSRIFVRAIVSCLRKTAEQVLVLNKSNYSKLQQMGVGTEKLRMMKSEGVNLDEYQYNEYLPKKRLSFLMVARLLKDKGVIEYLEAAEYVKSQYGDAVEFVLIGNRDTNPACVEQNVVDKYVVNNTVRHILEMDDIRFYYRESSVFVLPSYHEGFPRTILEAMAIGRPIITTDAPGCREAVVHTYNGYVVPVRNSKALALAMEKFIKKPELIRIMGVNSRKIAEDQHDVTMVVDEINAILQKH